MDLTASVLVAVMARAVSVPVQAVLVQENALVGQPASAKTRQFNLLFLSIIETRLHTTIYYMLAIIMCTSA